jgi:hypothetical protein
MSQAMQTLARASRRILSSRRSLALALAVAGLATAGCPEQTSSPPEAKAPCREVGQRCEFAPGKLGSCVHNDNCQGPNCYVCQSQH